MLSSTNLPDILFASDTEVPLPNLMKEDEMDMIDPEDPKPLSSTENKSNNLNNTVRPLTSPPTRKQNEWVTMRTISAGLFLLSGIVMIYYSIEAWNNTKNTATNEPIIINKVNKEGINAWHKIKNFFKNYYAHIWISFGIALIIWEVIVIIDIYTTYIYAYGKKGTFFLIQEFVQLIVSGICFAYCYFTTYYAYGNFNKIWDANCSEKILFLFMWFLTFINLIMTICHFIYTIHVASHFPSW